MKVDNDHLKPDKELQVDQSKVSNRSKTAVIDKSIYVSIIRITFILP